MSDAERPERLDAGRKVTAEDIRELMGASTPHFALQIRSRIRRLIESLPPGDPVRTDGERAIKRLERVAREGQATGGAPEHELPLPSLDLNPGG